MQAALILHGMLHMNSREKVLATVQQLSNFSTPSASNPAARTKTKATIELHQRIRNRYPLPQRMPRCVTLPVYHPENDRELLNFHNNKNTVGMDLVLKGVRGPAGQVGLRRGDVVTHVNGEAVRSQFDFRKALLEAAENGVAANTAGDSSSSPTMSVVVNADEETAKALKDRALKMQRENVRL